MINSKSNLSAIQCNLEIHLWFPQLGLVCSYLHGVPGKQHWLPFGEPKKAQKNCTVIKCYELNSTQLYWSVKIKIKPSWIHL